MVKVKPVEGSGNWMKDVADQINKDHPVVAIRWYVAEVTPSSSERVGNGHGGSEWEHVSSKYTVVSPYYDFKAEAESWKKRHIPDEGKTLEVRKQTGRQYIHWSG